MQKATDYSVNSIFSLNLKFFMKKLNIKKLNLSINSSTIAYGTVRVYNQTTTMYSMSKKGKMVSQSDWLITTGAASDASYREAFAV